MIQKLGAHEFGFSLVMLFRYRFMQVLFVSNMNGIPRICKFTTSASQLGMNVNVKQNDILETNSGTQGDTK